MDMLGGLYSKLAAIDGTLNSLRGHRGVNRITHTDNAGMETKLPRE